MENRVYYGEYSIKHWIDLMLKRNIVIPEYQRSFVWDEKDIKRLITSLESGQFVQPVTIANCNIDGISKNIILDGQQRLTSLLLFLLGYMPDKSKYARADDIATGDDSLEDSIETTENNKGPIGWTFEHLLEDNVSLNTLENIKKKISVDEKYKSIAIGVKREIDDFLNNTFLGFSYIVPQSNADRDRTQNFFSTLFRNMNYLGKKLSFLESRRSLYYMVPGYKNFFDGRTAEGNDVLCDIQLIENWQSLKIDFVRYLSIISQYVAKGRDTNKILVGYSAYSSRESFFADYVSYIVGLEQEDRIDKFDGFDFKSSFASGQWEKRFELIRTSIESITDKMALEPKKNAFKSWIDADYWLFGLLYWTLFEGKKITFEDELIKSILERIQEKKDSTYYTKNTNRLGILRERINESIQIYERYVH